ncbi:uncharacterized protein [Littorina saxatilis]|uniref:Glutathione S-transferase omega n=1 Tax=Littorina saxatilis TaxID=31220 RepID=A0AAN9G8T0_9CAEN
MTGKSTQLFSTWYCPFGQRSWIALLEKGVDFEIVETDPYNKTSEFLAISPRGLVPTLVHNGKSVYESFVINEYIEEAWPQQPKLMPSDPYDRAQARIWVDFIGKKIVPQFYHVLQSQEKGHQKEAKDRFLDGLRVFTSAMSSTEVPYFFGKDFGLVDIAFIPFALRFNILVHYRDFSLPSNGSFDRLKVWMDACKSRPSVIPTVAPRDKMIDMYKRYADNTCKSEIAEATRKRAPFP